jgi:hypothetical protein
MLDHMRLERPFDLGLSRALVRLVVAIEQAAHAGCSETVRLVILLVAVASALALLILASR